MRQEIRIGGFGGQGIVLAGHILGRAAIAAGKHAAMTQSYGPEMRGGRVAADVVLDDRPIDYPKVIRPEISVFLFQGAYEHHRQEIGPVLLYDQDLVQLHPEDAAREGRTVYAIRPNKIAEELGRRVVVNIAMLGALTALTDLLPAEVLEEAVLASVPRKALDLNREAFRWGLAHGLELRAQRKEVEVRR
ncbi:MAG: 2-oxoacid:acceptor oxidoreductase family protein [Candidatus Acetothermia bacterium]|jgi:2-oxoglutarate ferredoxin oxidoreductase subunit gamma|nr:2-oxoacid:acceptor oxidoreductase family protein [Candidatus Acetothermia bacterium]MDH7505973.1 2-oxoacid:acceptor oxidoreductase family protein [Candidatus Acetothermia bacterium]